MHIYMISSSGLGWEGACGPQAAEEVTLRLCNHTYIYLLHTYIHTYLHWVITKE